MCALNRFYYRDERVKFSQEIVNDAQLFNTTTHEFVCPVTGVYLLQAHFRSSSGFAFTANVMRNNTIIFSTVSFFNDQNGSNMATMECNESEAVYVEVTENGFLAGDETNQNSCITVVLLNAN